MFYLECFLIGMVVSFVLGVLGGIFFPESEEEKQRRLMKKNRRKKPYEFGPTGELLI